MKKRLFMHKLFMIRLLHAKNRVPMQVVDFSPVTNIFHLISSFFTPFFSQKGLISRRLRIKQGLIEAGGDFVELNRVACTPFWGGQMARWGRVSHVVSFGRSQFLTQSRKGAEAQSMGKLGADSDGKGR
jgi:hypothetical protein